MRLVIQNFRRLGVFGWLLLVSSPAWAQFTTATQDGTIDAATEYNNNQYVANDQGSGGGSWYLSWNGTTVYMAKTGATGNQPCYVYFDVDPVQPVTDFSGVNGGDAKGNLVGYSSADNPSGDFNIIPKMPFRADARLYFQNGYVGVSRRSGSGTWGPTVAVGTVGYNNGNLEIAVPWDALTGASGRPASFNFFAYQTNRSTDAGNYRFDLAPTNASAFGGAGGTQPPVEYYFTVLNTDSGVYPTASGTRPFSLLSFSARQGYDYSAFNSTNTWDFTLDYPTSSIERSNSAAGTNWNIGGTLAVGNGTLTFGSAAASGSTAVGSLLVAGGVLNMGQAAKPLNVTSGSSGHVLLSNGGTLQLSSTAGGDLNLLGNFTLQGTATVFQPNGRTVAFTGAAQTITGLATKNLAFSHLTLNGSSAASAVQLKSNVTVIGNLTFTQGQLRTVDASTSPATNYAVNLRRTGRLVNEREASALSGYVSTRRFLGAGGTSSVDFGGLGLALTPASTSGSADSVTVTRSRGLPALTGPNNTASIQRNYRLQPATAGGSYNVSLALNYFDSELNALPESSLSSLASPDAITTGAAPTGTFTNLALSSLDQTNNVATRNGISQLGQSNSTTGMVYTLGTSQATPLPVQLVSFGAMRTAGGAVRLSWATASEVANKGFGIERQAAGGQWQQVAFVPGQGAGQSLGGSYNYLDASAPLSLIYYRLRQLDQDGTTAYSPVVAVASAVGAATPAVRLSPVPVPAGQALLTVDLSALPASARTLAVYDLQGRLLLQATAAADATTTTLPVSELAAGTYLVQVSTGATSYRSRFIRL